MCTCLQGPQGPDDSYPECVCDKVKKIPHKHAALIKAWADGAIIEARLDETGHWQIVSAPSWHIGMCFRIKPEPKPDEVYYGVAKCKARFAEVVYLGTHNGRVDNNIKLTFDGETGKLKSVSILD